MKNVLRIALILALVPAALSAQAARNAQIASAARAYGDFDSPGALRILRVALNPASGPTDSVWASGVQLLAQILIEDGKEPLASTWLRWAFRQYPGMRIDSVTYLPAVVSAMKAARVATFGGSPGDPVTTTTFQWPAAVATDTMGFFRTPTSPLPVPIRVLVEGVGLLGTNQNLTLAPGTYNLQAQADGYVTARVAREVLPGTTTNLQFALRSTAIAAADTILGTDTRTRTERQLVRLSVRRFGTEPSCATGAFVSADGLVLTTYQAIRGADALEAEFADGGPVRSGIGVAAYDARRNIAVLKLAVNRQDSLIPSQDIIDGEYAWGLGYAACQGTSVARTRVESWTDRPNGLLQLSDSLATASQGGPVIDRSGNLIALGTASRSAVPGLHAIDLLGQARRNVTAGRVSTLAEVGRRENHLYGSLLIRSSASNGQVRVTPLETWQWSDLARQGPVPLTFAAPSGRYQVALLIAGQVAEQTTATVIAGTQTPVSINPVLAQGAVEPELPAKKSKSKAPLIIAGGGGAAALAVVLLLPKKPPGPPVDTTTTGTINIHIPVNP